jgi:pimeloyl-ACP methyl ester carboxylesterase
MSSGHKIAVHVIPGRSPVIVLDAGGGLDSSYWTSLVPQLARATGSEIITYDRAGWGRSEEVPGPWNVLAARDDLAAVLTRFGATRHVVLVPHSLAGEIALYLVRQHPRWFSGAVLVDANVPELYTDDFVAAQESSLAPLLSSSDPSTAAGRSVRSLLQSFGETSHAFHRETWPAAIPVTVVVSEKTPFDGEAAKLWMNAHAQFAQAAPNRTLVVATGSSHDVAHDRPDVIVTAVAEMVSRARAGH